MRMHQKDDGGNDDFKSALVVTKTLITTIENMVEMIYRVDVYYRIKT